MRLAKRATFAAIVLTLGMILAGAASFAIPPATTQAHEDPTQSIPAAVVQLEDEINDYTRDDLIRRFREAREQGAKAVILEIDSYGGAVIPALDTSRFLKQQGDLRVVAFIRKKAISAGALIAVACNEIRMAPNSFIGDSGVIAMSSEGMKELGPLERAKVESPVVEDFRDSAERNGYSALLLESMVVLDREVYFVEKDGDKRLVNGEEYKRLAEEGFKPVIAGRNPIDGDKSLLTLNATTAVQVGLSKATAASSEEVARQLNWNIVARFERTTGDRLVAFLASSAIRGLLITALVISIYLAVNTPGTGLPEVSVMACLGILLGIPLLTGFAQWWEVLLVLAGVGLLAVEIFIIPGFGFVGITGVLFILAGLVGTFAPADPTPGVLPSFQGAREALQEGFIVVTAAVTIASLGCMALARFLPRAPLFNRLVLTATVGGGKADGNIAAEAPGAVAATAWVNVGDEGQTLTDLRPGGTARFLDPQQNIQRTLDVICDSGFIPAKTPIRVHELQGAVVIVRRA